MTEIMLRSLPEGSRHAGILRARLRSRVEIELKDGTDPFPPGTPVEIVAEEMILLGISLLCEGSNLSVLLEHQIDVRQLDLYGASGRWQVQE